MKKLTLLFAFLCASVMGWATDYCHTEMSAGGKTIYLTCQQISTGNYQLKVECNEAMSGLGGSFCNVNGVGGYQLNAAGHFVLAADGKTITCDIASSTAPTVYTPLYVLIDGEKNFGDINDASWASCGGSSTPEPEPDPEPEPEPDPNSYTAGGHTIHLEAYHIDDVYTLNITSTDDMSGLGGSFWNVNGVGTDMRSNDATKSYTVSGDKKTITCEVQSSSAPNIYTPLYVLMPGEVNFGDVTLNWEDRTPVTSEYCNYQDPQTVKEGKNIALTWETNASGDVVITMTNGTGATSCSFRNGGFEGGIGAFIVSTDDFATSEAASNYFSATQVYSGNTYTLTKTADLPENAKIKHVGSGHALAWVLNGNNEYCYPDFIYTYGTTCNQLDAPTNVAIDGTNHITFNAVDGAESYTAYVSLGGVQKYSQVVASGDELTYEALVTGDYTVNVVASGAGKVDSDPSADYVWHLEAVEIVLGNSEYCETNKSSGNTLAAFTWETDANGNIMITISEVLGGAAADTHFRGNALALGNFKVGAGQTAGSNYFSHPGTTTGNQLVLTATTAPALGEKIYYHGVVEYATSKDGNAWPTLDFEWTYGTVCSGKAVSATPNDNTMGTAVVKKGDEVVTSVEDGDEVTFIATSKDAELYRFVNWTKGGVVVSTEATYVTTITESTNLIANFEYIKYTYCHAEINSIQNKKLYMTLGSIGGGKYQIKFEGSAEAKLTGLNNANYTINWVTTDIEDSDKKMSGQDVPFNNARWAFDASGYGSATATFGIAEGHTWEDIYVWNHAIYFSTPEGEVGYTGFPERYNIAWNEACYDEQAPQFESATATVLDANSVRLTFTATDNWEGFIEYTIARAGADDIVINKASGEEVTQDITGLTTNTEYTFTITASDGYLTSNRVLNVTPIADQTKPVMTAASVASKTWSSAVINVAAEDEFDAEITKFRVADPINQVFTAKGGQITLTGLTANTAYDLTITALDAVDNESEEGMHVSFTTDKHDLVPPTGAPVPTWPAAQVKSLYSDTYAFAPASLNSYNEGWWAAPVMTEGDVDDNHYLHYNLAADGMIGWQFGQISVALMENLHIDIFASAAGTVSIRPIIDGDGALNDNRKSLTLAAQDWNSFDIPLSEFGDHDWTKVFQFSIEYWNAGGLTGEHISVDNVYFYRTTEYVDNEHPDDFSATLTEESFYSVKITAQAADNSDEVYFSVKNGEDVVASSAAASNEPTVLTINNLTPGTAYNFNVIVADGSGNELAPIVIDATTKALPAQAPLPDTNGKVVVNVFSDALPGGVAYIGLPYWGQVSACSFINRTDEDKLFFGQNFNFQGWDGFSVDATDMMFLHLDVYTQAVTSLDITPISPGHEGHSVHALTLNAWTSIDIPLTDYANNNIDWSNIFQFKFFEATPAGKDLFIDNVYFWQPAAKSNVDMWATFASAADVKVPNDVTVYKAVYQSSGNEDILVLSDAGKVIPAGTGVLMKTQAANTTYAFAAATAAEVEAAETSLAGNSLVGCTVRTDISSVAAENDIFCLRRSEDFGMSGFFLYSGQYIPAGKAYLALPKNPSQPSSAPRHVRFVFDQTTDIQSAQGNDVLCTKFIENGRVLIRRGDAVYTIEGIRVQ